MANPLSCRPASRSIIGLVLLATPLTAMSFVRSAQAAEVPPPQPTETIEGHPALHRSPRHTSTAHGHQGDAVNVAFIGREQELHQALAVAGWYAADPVTLTTSLRIAADVVLHKPYAHAPVSDLYLWGRRQDAAFEQPVGRSPKQRHHVRFWRLRNSTTRAGRSGSGRPPSTSGSNSAARPAA